MKKAEEEAKKATEEPPKIEELTDETAEKSVAADAKKNVLKKVEEKKAEVPKPPAPKSDAVKEYEKISTYNGAETDKYSWS